MPRGTPASILRHLTRAEPGSDRELLARFVAEQDDAAFAELVRRHGPLVLAACRRGTRDHHDADEVFQAVFLTLARRAASINNSDLLGHWLYRVAVRVAWRARRAAARRRVHEVQAADAPEPTALPREPDDLGPVLDEELARLSAAHRDALVLCDLQGLARADAAARLGVPLGTLASRLDKARRKLAAALTRRGIALSAAAVPGVVADVRAAAASAALLDKACAAAAGAAPRVVLQLAHGGVMMRVVTTVGLVTASLALAGVGLTVRPGEGQTPVAPPPRLAADPSTPPKELVLRAWEETAAGLRSGIGEGVYEVSSKDGTAQYHVRVAHAGPKFRAELARVQPPGPWPPGPLVPAEVVVCDGRTLAYREQPSTGEALLVTAPAGDVFRHAATTLRLDPTRLAPVDLPAYVRNRPGTTFDRRPDGVTATERSGAVTLTLGFPRAAGYNPASFEVRRADNGYRDVKTVVWERSDGVWYVKEAGRAYEAARPLDYKQSSRLAYSKFEANAEVDPALFRLSALGVARGARLLYHDAATGVVELYKYDRAAEREGDTLLDGLRRLPHHEKQFPKRQDSGR